MPKVRMCSTRDLRSVFQITEKHTSFDAAPTFADIEGLYARNPDCFFVAEDDSEGMIDFITGYEKSGIPENVLRTWNACELGHARGTGGCYKALPETGLLS